MSSISKQLHYEEQNADLAIRINAHKAYSNFSLEEWIIANIPIRPGMAILDIGCGSGNMFPVYHAMTGGDGVVVGIDQSAELLEAAQTVCPQMARVLLEWDMNRILPLLKKSIDIVVSTFAIYYVDNVEAMMIEIGRVLKEDGFFYLIGPTQRNALELMEYNARVFGMEQHKKAERRSQRIESEFYPVASRLFHEVHMETIPSKLVFPGVGEYLQYYEATPLYRESVDKASVVPDRQRMLDCLGSNLEISKEMVVLWGKA